MKARLLLLFGTTSACSGSGQEADPPIDARRSVSVTEIEEFPLSFPRDDIGEGAPILHATIDQLGEHTEDEVLFERDDDRTFSLPGDEPLGSASFYAPPADECFGAFGAEVVLELLLPEDWSSDLRQSFEPERVVFDDWETHANRPELVCLGSRDVVFWCVELRTVRCQPVER